MENFFNFPIVKRVEAGTIGDSIKPCRPMSLEEAAAGRIIKPYPFKYDTFASAEDLKNYIEDVLHNDKELNAEWLEAGSTSHLPFNLRDDVYYTPVSSFNISCYKPSENILDDRIQGQSICKLKGDDLLIKEVDKIIEDIKKMFKKD